MRISGIRKSKGEKLFLAVNNLILFFLGMLTLFPFYVVAVQSFAPPEDFIFKEIILWPSRFDFSYFRIVFGKASTIYDAYKATIYITVIGTMVNMILTVVTAYALSKKTLPFRKQITLFMVFTMYFGGGMVPGYLLVRSLHLIDSLWALILPGAISTYLVLIMRNFIMGIPKEIMEAATIDGCSEIVQLVRIIVPLSIPSIATVSLFYAVGHWNEFSGGLLYINKPELAPLQVYLRHVLYDATQLESEFQDLAILYAEGRYKPPSDAIKSATIMAATVPIILVYPFIQKYFVKGMTIGSLKG